jgi:hypothetical protein
MRRAPDGGQVSGMSVYRDGAEGSQELLEERYFEQLTLSHINHSAANTSADDTGVSVIQVIGSDD